MTMWRVGTKLGRTLYRGDACVGMVDTREIAEEIVATMNDRARLTRELAEVRGHSRDLVQQNIGIGRDRDEWHAERDAAIARAEKAEARVARLREALIAIQAEEPGYVNGRIPRAVVWESAWELATGIAEAALAQDDAGKGGGTYADKVERLEREIVEAQEMAAEAIAHAGEANHLADEATARAEKAEAREAELLFVCLRLIDQSSDRTWCQVCRTEQRWPRGDGDRTLHLHATMCPLDRYQSAAFARGDAGTAHRCFGAWTSGSGGHRVHDGSCDQPATVHEDDDLYWYCARHAPNDAGKGDTT